MSTNHYIEFIGLPGSGKTEAAKLLLKRLQEEEIRSSLRIPIKPNLFFKIKIILGVCLTFFQTPTLLRLWFSPTKGDYSAVPGVQTVAVKVRRRLIAEIVIVKYLLAQDAKVLINDEGLIGKVVVLSLQLGLEEDLAVELLREILPENILIVHVATPNNLAIVRVAQRNTELPFFDDMSAEVKTKFYTQNSELYGRVCERLHSVQNARVIRIQNTGTQAELIEELEVIFLEMFQ